MENTSSQIAPSSAAGAGAMAFMGGLMGSVQEKFNNAGGNEVVSSVTNAIPQNTKDYFAEAKSKFFNLNHLRSPRVFFGLGEEKPFYMERTVSLIIARLQHNFSFFYMNYMLITSILFVLTLLISPGTIIGIGLLGLAWASVIKATQQGHVTIKNVTITQKQASIGMAIVSALVLVYLLSSIFWWTLGSSGFLAGVHGFLRDASMHKDEEDKIEMTGDIAPGEDASFLNPAVDVV